MGSWENSDESWAACSKLLLKLQLIDETTFAASFAGCPKGVAIGPLSYGGSLALFDEWDAIQLVAHKLGIRPISISKSTIGTVASKIDSDAIKRIPLEQWRQFRAFPMARERGVLTIALANPLARSEKQAIDFALGESTQVAIAEEAQILNVLNRYHSAAHEASFANAAENRSSSASAPTTSESTESRINTSDVDAPPVVRLVNKIFLDAFERGASDIHVSPEKEKLVVRVRTDGLMSDLISVPNALSAATLSRIKLLAGMDISERRRPQDGRLRIQLGDSHRDLRVSTVPTLYGENLVARVLNSDPTHISFTSLGMPDKTLEQVLEDLSGTSQVILVTGPTGSGKTSTLYAGIMRLKDGRHNIITIEDPIEYRVEGITQIQVNQKIGMTFAETLRSVLRQDPDVVVVGEIRDGETASIAMQTAQTGHVVMATLHTNSAASAITRLRDLGIPPYLIASSVRGVMAQRLVRRLCKRCAIADETPETLELLGEEIPAKPRCAVGCDHCGGSGYSGRSGIYSYLHLSEEVRESIRANSGELEIESVARSYGFRSLEEAALDLVRAGITSLDEAIRVIGPALRHHFAASTPTLTKVESIPEPVAVAAPKPTQKQLATSFAKKKILVVDDDENMRFVMAMVLERAMFEVTQAENGRKALEEVFANRPDLILCDVMMPHMDGTETLKILRRDPQTRDIPVLMLTAADTEENEIRLLECGADDFVSKMADQKVILTRVQRLLQRS